MKSRLCQIMNWAYDYLGQVTSGKRFRQDGTPVAGQQFEYAFDGIGNRKTAGQGGDHECISNSGTLSGSSQGRAMAGATAALETLGSQLS